MAHDFYHSFNDFFEDLKTIGWEYITWMKDGPKKEELWYKF